MKPLVLVHEVQLFERSPLPDYYEMMVDLRARSHYEMRLAGLSDDELRRAWALVRSSCNVEWAEAVALWVDRYGWFLFVNISAAQQDEPVKKLIQFMGAEWMRRRLNVWIEEVGP